MKLKTKLVVVVIVLSSLSCGFVFAKEKPKSISSKSHLILKKKRIEERSEYLRKKIEETREKEKIEVSKLTEIQRRLYKTQEQLRKNRDKLIGTQNSLDLTTNKLTELKSDYSVLQTDAENRIRQIYEGQRLRILEILLKTPNLTDLLDLLYYQKLLVAQDKELLEKLSLQSKEIENYKDHLSQQKIEMAQIVSKINDQKRKIAGEHALQSEMVTKLRTERASYEQAERQLERDSQQLISEINDLVGNNYFNGPGLPGSGAFTFPVRGRLTSPFGMRRHPIFKVVSFHSGVDLAAPFGTAIMASDSGRVIFNGWYGGYGKVVIVDHGKNYSTLYAHLSRATARRGKNILKGEIIGYEGQTGYSTGPHLHFEVRKGGRPQNPLNYLR